MTDFDERAKEWDSDPKRAERARAVAEVMRKTIRLSTSMNALEYGCGTGLLSFALQSDLGCITLADASQGMLDVLSEKIAKAGVTNMRPMRLDLAVDPLPAERYDLTYSLMTLHHIDDTESILTKFHAVLEANGYLFVADLDQEDGSFHTDGSTDVHKGFERGALQRQVEEIGFGNVTFSTAYEIKKKINGEEKVFPVFLMAAQKIKSG
ncbi:MAG TPA: class I SAM-dependent methyltransferase [Anaerolineales bacterium]|nr:class I SAM-dependent methyltransferase [Anaerolineales bacterium]